MRLGITMILYLSTPLGRKSPQLGGVPVSSMLPRRAVSSINSHLGTNFLQQREGTDHSWMVFLSQHSSGIKLNGAEDGSDPACREVLDLPESMAIRANPAKKAYVSA